MLFKGQLYFYYSQFIAGGNWGSGNTANGEVVYSMQSEAGIGIFYSYAVLHLENL